MASSSSSFGTLLVVLLSAAGYVIGQDVQASACEMTGFNFNDEKCEEGWKELWKETAGAQSNRMCCDPNHKMYRDGVRDWKEVCRPTECLSSSAFGGSTCSSFYDRSKSGKLLKYDEILRERCATPYGSPGVVGLCCEKGSVEGALATALGSEPNEFPHMVKMRNPSQCGGTVYNRKWIVTAAHCIVDGNTGQIHDPSSAEIVIGSNIGTVEANQFVHKVKTLLPHPGYSRLNSSKEFKKGNRSRLFNDIALMELQKEIRFGPRVRALEIAPKGFNPLEYSDKAVIVGWGTTENLELTQFLQKSNFEVRNDSLCFQSEKPYMKVYRMVREFQDSLLCLGGVIDGKYGPTAGKGDSGGPAICRGEDGKILLCGVSSFGGASNEGCAKHNDEKRCPPSVYTEVAYFHDWIQSVAGEQEEETFHKPYLYGEPVTSKKEYPHQVHITSSSKGKPCGGTLVAPKFVVTAAQCVAEPGQGGGAEPYPGLKVTYGITDLNEKGRSVGVKALLTLPGYSLFGSRVGLVKQGNHIRRTDSFFRNDLAVLKLTSKVNINSFPGFPKSHPEFGSELAFPRPTQTQTNPSSELRSRDFRFLGHGDCQARMTRVNITVDRNLLCGVETFSGGSTCDRELGGGLICNRKNGREELCGVQVFRMCDSSIPNGFMNMLLFKDWVKWAMRQLKAAGAN